MTTHKALSDLIHRMYLAAEDTTRWTGFLEPFAEAIGGRDTNLIIVDWDRTGNSLQANVRSHPDTLAAYRDYWNARNPYVQSRHPFAAAEGAIVTGRQLVPDAVLRGTPFYHEFLRPAGIDDLLGINVFVRSSLMACVVTHYGPDDGERTRGQIELARCLLPHLQRAVEISIRLQQTSLHESAFSRMLEKLPGGLLLVEGRGLVRHLNRTAKQILDRKDGLRIVSGQIVGVDRRSNQELQACIAGACRTSNGNGFSAGGTVYISRPAGQAPYVATVSPVSVAGRLREIYRAAAVISIKDPAAEPSLSPLVLRRTLGLTRAEARIALALLEDKTREEIASDFGITINTMRTHMRSLLGKAGVRHRPALVKLLMNLSQAGSDNKPE